MHTVIIGIEFQKKCKKKYDPEYIENIIENISHNPKIGKKNKRCQQYICIGYRIYKRQKV